MSAVLREAQLKIDSEDDIVLVRRHVRDLAQQIGLDSFASAAITTATSELTRNVWVHAARGSATIQEVSQNGRRGIRAVFEDDGPGIDDLERVMRGGVSTARSLGLGLSGSKRLVDAFEIDTQPGRGTRVTILKWARYW